MAIAIQDDLNVKSIGELPPDSDPSLEHLTLLVIAKKVSQLNSDSAEKLKDVTEKQKVVAELHKHLKAVNKATQESGELDLTNDPELQELLRRANELGADVDPDKTKYSMLERERLVENIRTTIEDLTASINMGLQEVSRFHDERNEVYQLARMIQKSLQEPKQASARAIK